MLRRQRQPPPRRSRFSSARARALSRPGGGLGWTGVGLRGELGGRSARAVRTLRPKTWTDSEAMAATGRELRLEASGTECGAQSALDLDDSCSILWRIITWSKIIDP